MLLPRVITAVIGIPLALALIHMGGLPYIAFIAGVAALALHEYGLMLWLGGRGVQRVLTLLGGVALTVSVALDGPAFSSATGIGLTHLTVTGVLSAAALREILRAEHSLDRAALTVFGSLFIGWTLGHLSLIRELSPRGEAWTYLLFASVWATDTVAYFAGNFFGRNRMAPVLSPRKTWEGLAAGMAGAMLTVWLFKRGVFKGGLASSWVIGFGILIGGLGQLSDLSQSMIKRASGVKDSSALLPGHGGVFDRMDSFFLLAPVFYWCLLLGPAK